MLSYVYCITNLTNDKKYVGATIWLPQRRWKRHIQLASSGSNCAIHGAIRKYGFENFKFEVLEECSGDPKECFHIEPMWIAKLKTRAPLGYNRTAGGEGAPGAHRRMNLDEREMRSASAKRRFEDPAERKKMSPCQDFKKMPVNQLTLSGKFVASYPSMMEAERLTGIGHINDCCHGRRNKAGGFTWQWV